MRTVTAAVGMVVVLVACGGSDDAAPSTANEPGTPAVTSGNASPRPVPADGVELTVEGTVEAASTGHAYALTLTITNHREGGIAVLPLSDGPAEPIEEDGVHVLHAFLPVADGASDAVGDAPPAVDGAAVAPGEARQLSAVVGLTIAPPIDLVVCLEVADKPGLAPGDDATTLVLPAQDRSEVDAVCSDPVTIG